MRWTLLAKRLSMVTVLLAVTTLSLSDSIMGPVRAGASTARGVGRAVESGAMIDLGSGSHLPVDNDTFGHFLLWGLVGLVAAGQVDRARTRLLLFVGLFALSGAIEIGQQYLSWSRSAELTDLAGNGVGLALGLLAWAVLSAIGRLRSRPTAT